MQQYRFAGIIPARYASTRFPGKPLADIGGKTMVQRVYEQVSGSVDILYVATDDRRIHDEVLKFGGNSIMTSAEHLSGTDRCAEAAEMISAETGNKIDIVINIQGDEPFIKPEQIGLLKSCFGSAGVDIATLIRECAPGEDVFNPNQVKVITGNEGFAIYFSRSAIPFIRDHEPAQWTQRHLFYKHIGLYAYRTEVLKTITKLPPGKLERAESLEQNRWIENGLRIKCALTKWDSISIDTPDDLKQALDNLEHFDKNP